MKTIARPGTVSIALALGLLALLVWSAPGAGRTDAPETPEAVIRTWPVPERTAARAMIEKYGRPGQFDGQQLVWFHNGAWKRTIVYRQGPHHVAKTTDKDFLEQTVGYIVPADKIEALTEFSPRLEASPTAGELTFASNSEATNRLALNLANEIVVGKRTAADARSVFSRITRLAASGKSFPYLEGLRFDVDNDRFMTPTGADQ
jgi:hypothetical protein